jgi:hypothetical protein
VVVRTPRGGGGGRAAAGVGSRAEGRLRRNPTLLDERAVRVTLISFKTTHRGLGFGGPARGRRAGGGGLECVREKRDRDN